MKFAVRIAGPASRMIEKLEAPERKTLLSKLHDLEADPDKRGKPLSGELRGYRSIHFPGRFRVVYEVKSEAVIVLVVAVGIRKEGDKKDVYEVLKKLVRAKLID